MEGSCLFYQLFLLSRSHGSQFFLKVLLLFLLHLLSQTRNWFGLRQRALAAGLKGRGSQLLYDGLAGIFLKAPEGFLIELKIVGPACNAPVTPDFLRQVKAQMGGFPGKGVGEAVFLHGSPVQLWGQPIAAYILQGLLIEPKKASFRQESPLRRRNFREGWGSRVSR